VLPECVFALFCVLFGITINEYQTVPRLRKAVDDYKSLLQAIQEQVLGPRNEFLDIFKIGLFIKALRVLFEVMPAKDDIVDRRVTDLMRSEFSVLKFTDVESFVATLGSNVELGEVLNQPLTNQTHFNMFLMYIGANHLLFKHMTDAELDTFVYKQCFNY
jgi:hypothetical protein